jgi:uncharacterized protein
MKDKYNGLKQKLDEQFSWPGPYMFKFIVPSEKADELKDLFPDDQWLLKSSRSGNYISLTLHKVMNSSDDVISFYRKAEKVKGLIAL